MPNMEDFMSMEKILSQFRPSLIHDPAPFIPSPHRIAYGTFAGMVATALVHPFDLIKTRLQINPFPYSTFQMAKRIMKGEGYLAFYNGLSASLYRQLFATTTRLSCYNYMYDVFKKTYKRRPSPLEKVKIGLVAGVAGAVVGNPSEVVLVRMMASSAPRAYNNCPDLQGLIDKRYTSFTDAINRIIMEEGVMALWRGGCLTVIRSMLNTCSSIGAYAVFREFFRGQHVSEGYFLHVVTAMCSSMVFTVVSLPVDIVKTRYQMRRTGITQRQIFTNIVKKRGPLYFWKRPLPPYYFRLTMHTLTSFFVIEAIENAYEKEEKHYFDQQKEKKDVDEGE